MIVESGEQPKMCSNTTSARRARAGFVPWQGIDRAIAEGVTFRNGEYTCEVHVGLIGISAGKETRTVSASSGA